MSHPLVVNKKTSEYDVYCGRGSQWGNPWTHRKLDQTKAKFQVATKDESIRLHREWFLKNKPLMALAKQELKGKVLGCYCAPSLCHCDIIAEVANS
jgi:Domain of unknown function (DUF4326)